MTNSTVKNSILNIPFIFYTGLYFLIFILYISFLLSKIEQGLAFVDDLSSQECLNDEACRFFYNTLVEVLKCF